MCVRVSRYTQVVKQSNSVSLETPTNEGGLSLADNQMDRLESSLINRFFEEY